MRADRRPAALTVGLVAIALAITAGVAAWAMAGDPAKPAVGINTSLPIYWREAGSISDTIDGPEAPHWARTALERRYRLEPLDTLDGARLAPLHRLLLAQPRPLSASENVALDDWVRGGGRLLLFADPMLTGESRFPLGDRRRPQDVVLLSPILSHWGLDLRFDPDQEGGARMATILGAAVPVDRAGQFAARPGGPCTVEAEGLLARCAIGKGQAVIVADAALLEGDRSDAGPAFAQIAARAFDD